MGAETTGLQHRFALDSRILATGSAAVLDLSGSTDADVALAIVRDDPFPARPDGQIALGHIGLTVSGGNPVAFAAGPTTVGFEFGAGATAGAAVFDTPRAALQALAIGETPGLDLDVRAAQGTRVALLRAGYTAHAAVKGTHPIGALGGATFGVSARSAGTTAVLHCFPARTGARTVLERTVASWKLPRHVTSAASLAPGTWLLAEADGTLAVKLAARLGYNFDFVREAKLAGVSGDIGLKIDAAATATFGFEVSGRYLVALARESEAETLRLQLFKLARKGVHAGLNLRIGVRGVETVTPGEVDEFVAAVFGVHGTQIVGALTHLDEWTDPSKKVSDLVAGLVNDRALELLARTTGINPATAFDAARRKLLGAIAQFQALPERVSAELWTLFGTLGPTEAGLLKRTLELLGSPEERVQKAALDSLLSTRGFAATPAGRIVGALADRGLLALFERLPEVRGTSQAVLAILDGDVIGRLQAHLAEALNLQRVLGAVRETDFAALDSLLVGRLSAFFDKTIAFGDLDEVRKAIHVVIGKRAEVYARVKKALTSRYGLDLSAAWQRTTARTAVLDAVFDTTQAEGRALLSAVLAEGDIDALFVNASPAVQVNAAVLTHEFTRKTSIDVALPRFSLHREHFTTAMARVSVVDEGSRVLLYEATGQDVVAVRRKFQSSLSVSLRAAVPVDGSPLRDLRVHGTDQATWSYQLLHGKNGMRREELEAYTRPFIERYMPDHFVEGTTLSAWYNEVDRTVEEVLANGPEEFGDVCASFEVTLPGDVLGAWMRPHDDVTSASRAMSKAIQAALKDVVRFYYLADIERLRDLAPSAALLAWAAIPPSGDVRTSGGRITLDAGKRVFWNHVDPDLRRVMLHHPAAAASLLAMLPTLRLRLEEAGLHRHVQFYRDGEVPTILATAASGPGDILVRGLLTFEAIVVEKAADAFADIQKFLRAARSTPTTAVDRLADFAADITTAFNKLAGNTVFGGVSLRAVSQTVFAEASRALDPGLVAAPRAMLVLHVLRPASSRTFTIADFLAGKVPPDEEVVLAQHLVSA
jgi:hypothetical protein